MTDFYVSVRELQEVKTNFKRELTLVHDTYLNEIRNLADRVLKLEAAMKIMDAEIQKLRDS